MITEQYNNIMKVWDRLQDFIRFSDIVSQEDSEIIDVHFTSIQSIMEKYIDKEG